MTIDRGTSIVFTIIGSLLVGAGSYGVLKQGTDAGKIYDKYLSLPQVKEYVVVEEKINKLEDTITMYTIISEKIKNTELGHEEEDLWCLRQQNLRYLRDQKSSLDDLPIIKEFVDKRKKSNLRSLEYVSIFFGACLGVIGIMGISEKNEKTE